jgi:hypothetical protein
VLIGKETTWDERRGGHQAALKVRNKAGRKRWRRHGFNCGETAVMAEGFPGYHYGTRVESVRDREKLSHNKGSPQMTSNALTWYERIRREKRVLSEGKF